MSSSIYPMVQRLSYLSVVVALAFAPVNRVFAEPGFALPDPSRVISVAGDQTKTKKSKSKSRRRRKTQALESVKGFLGLVVGDETAVVVGGDYILPLSKLFKKMPEAVSLAGGGSFWRNSGINIISLDVGADYSFWANPKTRFYGGGRLSYSSFSGTSGATSVSTSSFYLTPIGGFDYKLSGKAGFVGAEVKFPLTSKIDGVYILATYRFEFDWDN